MNDAVKPWLDKLLKESEGRYIPSHDVIVDVFGIIVSGGTFVAESRLRDYGTVQKIAYDALIKKSRPMCGCEAIRKLLEMDVCLKDSSLGMKNSAEFKDGFIKAHNRHVEVYSAAVCRSLGYGQLKSERISLAGEFHDIGKIAVPDSVLNKPDVLTEEERNVHIRPHPDTGANMLGLLAKLFGVDFEDVIPNVRYHHEWRSGSGYPYGLRDSDIPLGAQVISVCDVFDALTSKRPYKEPVEPAEALEIMAQEAGHFDPDLLEHAKKPLLKTFFDTHPN